MANGGSTAVHMELIIDQGGLGAGSDPKPTPEPFLNICFQQLENHNTLLV